MLAKENTIAQIGRLSLAIELAKVGARPQLIMSETGYSKDKARKIYFDATGKRPATGQAPYSPDEFVKLWRLNIDASLFANIHASITSTSQVKDIDALIKSYRLYLEHVHLRCTRAELSFTRAWTLLRLLDANLIVLSECIKCRGKFVAHDSVLDFTCCMCKPEHGRRRNYSS